MSHPTSKNGRERINRDRARDTCLIDAGRRNVSVKGDDPWREKKRARRRRRSRRKTCLKLEGADSQQYI